MGLSTTQRICACALAGLLMSAGVANAETRVRIQNTSPHPANIMIDKRSRDVQPRRAGVFPINGTTADMLVVFANGDASKGELDVSDAAPAKNAEDGNDYYCVTIDTDGLQVQTQADCLAAITKK